MGGRRRLHGAIGARRRTVREGPAFDRRPRPEPPLHHAFSPKTDHQVVRLRVTAATPAGQEVPRAAHRLVQARTKAGCRAHADPRHEEPAGRDGFTSLRRSLGLRQDQSGDADSAGRLPWLEGRTVGDDICWMRPARRGRVCTRSIRKAGFRRRPGTSANPTRYDMDPARHHLHQRRRDRRQPAVVEGLQRPCPCSAIDWRNEYDSEALLAHPNSPPWPSSAVVFAAWPRTRAACRSARSLAAGASSSRR